jgi:hypothetical protein
MEAEIIQEKYDLIFKEIFDKVGMYKFQAGKGFNK